VSKIKDAAEISLKLCDYITFKMETEDDNVYDELYECLYNHLRLYDSNTLNNLNKNTDDLI